VIVDRLDPDRAEFATLTGWVVKPEGACKGEVCVPLPAFAYLPDDRLDLTVVADSLGMPLVADVETGLRALGPAAVTGRALDTAETPDLELPDLDGAPFRLSSLRGTKVLLLAWASW
jgi:hypothetical protein